MKKLISLEEHNRAVEDSQLIPNGIECPHCRKELYDKIGNECYVGQTKVQNIQCKGCCFHGTRGIKKEPISPPPLYTIMEF